LNIDCEVEMIFRGLEPVPRTLHITGGQRVSEPVKLFARLSDTEVNPSAKLDRCLTAVKPTAPGQVLPLGERDILPDGTPFYQMQVEYSVDFDESCDIIPRWRGLQNVLYESDFHAQLFMVLDSSKKVIGVGDAFPSFIKIPKKGAHTIRLQIRHSSPKVLEGLVEIPVIIERKIKEISMNFHQLQSNALIGKDKVNTKTLTKGQAISIYCKEPENSQIPK
jgi:tripeptidyl-peptidase-2